MGDKEQARWKRAGQDFAKEHRDTFGLLVSGGVAGSVAKTLTAPLSRLTILFQVHSMVTTKPHAPQYAESLSSGLRKVLGKEGFLAFWKGNGTAVIHRFPYSAINFHVYESVFAGLKSWGGGGATTSADTIAAYRFVGGALAGGVATTVCYPLDLVRTRLTTQVAGAPRAYEGIFHCVVKIAKDEGLPGLYRGLGITLLVQMPNLAISYSSYGFFRDLAMTWLCLNPAQKPRAAANPTAAASTAAASSPHSSRGGGPGGGAGMGPKADMAGGGPLRRHLTVASPSASEAVLADPGQAPAGAAAEAGDEVTGGELAEQPGNGNDSRGKETRANDVIRELTPVQMGVNLGCGALSGICATLVMFPVDVLRRRMQLQGLHRPSDQRLGPVSEAKLILRTEGVKGLYRGLTPELCKIVPMVGTTFGVYELLKDWLQVGRR